MKLPTKEFTATTDLAKIIKASKDMVTHVDGFEQWEIALTLYFVATITGASGHDFIMKAAAAIQQIGDENNATNPTTN